MSTKKIILLTAVLPIGATSLTTLIACLLRMFYFDLPTFLAEAWGIFYSASFFVMDFTFYFSMGIFCMLLMFGGKKQIVLSSALIAVIYPINPFLQYLIRHLTIATKLYSDEMQEFFATDITTVLVNLMCIGLLAIIAIVIKIIFLHDKCEIKASLLPKNPALCIYTVYCAVMIIFIFADFLIDGAYVQNLATALLQALLYIVGYIIAFAGAATAAHDIKKSATPTPQMTA